MGTEKKNGKEVKNAVVDTKCKKSAEECKDQNCPVHKPAEEIKPLEEDLTPSAQAAPPGSVCQHMDGNQQCGRPREEHTIRAAEGDVAFDHNFIAPTYKGDEKVAAVEATGRALVAGAQEIPIDSKFADGILHDAPAEDRDLIRFVMSKGYTARGAASLLAHSRDEIVSDFGKERATNLDDVTRQALVDALSLIKHIPHQNDFTKSVTKRIEDILDPPVELFTLDEAKARLGV